MRCVLLFFGYSYRILDPNFESLRKLSGLLGQRRLGQWTTYQFATWLLQIFFYKPMAIRYSWDLIMGVRSIAGDLVEGVSINFN